MMFSALRQRFLTPASDTPDMGLVLVRGNMGDYNVLKAYHYRADRPATATRVLALRHPTRTPAARFLNNNRYRQHTVAVLIESMPSLSCKMRNWALDDRYGSWLRPRAQAALLNQEVRVISRVVVHPCWRGLGLAVRLVRAALEEPTTLFTEALAAMGRVNPFFEHAGMTAYPRQPHTFDARLVDAMKFVGLAPCDLALPDQTLSRIESLERIKRDWFYKELHRWYRQHGARAGCRSTDPMAHLRAARSRLMLEPIYYLHDNSENLAQGCKQPVNDNTIH